MNTSSAGRRGASRAWFPGRYIAISGLTGLEVLGPRHRCAVHVSKTTTLHGTPAELRYLAAQLLRAAKMAESAS